MITHRGVRTTMPRLDWRQKLTADIAHGESGTGKDHLARFIHKNSKR
jgi:transcriptional regulator of acetoin/glycerol metabolism